MGREMALIADGQNTDAWVLALRVFLLESVWSSDGQWKFVDYRQNYGRLSMDVDSRWKSRDIFLI